MGFEGGAFLGQELEHAGEALLQEWIGGGLEAVGFGLVEALHLVEAAQETAQELLLDGERLPGGQRAIGTEAGDELSIDLIGLVAATEAAGVVLDAAGVGEVDLKAGGVESGGGQIAVMTGGFEDDRGGNRGQFTTPGDEFFQARWGVGKLVVMGGGTQKQTGVERRFGDVEAQAG